MPRAGIAEKERIGSAGAGTVGAGLRAVYCALDPATAIPEVAVHKGFQALDTVPHAMTAALISDLGGVHIVQPEAVPNPNWLRPGIPSAGQQAFGDESCCVSIASSSFRALSPRIAGT